MGGSSRLGFRYARSADGTSIAWTRLGSGPPLVVVPPVPFSNVTGDWAVPLLRSAYEGLARSCELILYDGRGTGTSQRTVSDVSIEAQAADLVAVLDDAGVERAAALALYLASAPAVRVAAERPERLSHLVLFGAIVDGAEALARPGTDALIGLIDSDWALFSRTAALDWMGWRAAGSGELVARSFETATTPDIAGRALDSYRTADLRDLLRRVRAPSLVLHRREGRQVSLEQSSALAALLPQGRLHVLEGESATLFFDDPEGTVATIADFVAPGHVRPLGGGPSEAAAGLTGREREVLCLIARGGSNAEIAHELGLSIHTIERHAANVYRKIQARGRADATAWALRHGLD